MALRPPSEKRIQYLADDILSFIISYFVTFWAIFRHPRSTIPKLIHPDESSADGMLPSAFFVANILLVFSFRKMLGFSLSDFPLPLQGGITFPIAFLRYLLGFLVLLAFLLLFVSRRDFPRGMTQIAPVLCYASVVYLPLSFIGMLLSRIFAYQIIKSFAALFDYFTSIGNRELLQIEWFSFIVLIVLLIFYAACVLWWLYLIYVGLKSIDLQLPYNALRKLLWACFFYLLTKGGSIFLVSVILYLNTIVTILQWGKLERVILENPFKCGTALVLAEQVSNDDTLPIYPRYVGSIVSASCISALFIQNDGGKKEIEQAITAIRESKFELARSILENYISELPKSKLSGRVMMVKKTLKKADELYKSPDFFVLKAEGFMLTIGIPSAPIALFP